MRTVKPQWHHRHLSDEAIKSYKLLDTINLDDYLARYREKEVWDVMEELEKEYEGLFNAISESDFADYINSRYGRYSTNEQTVYKVNHRFGL